MTIFSAFIFSLIIIACSHKSVDFNSDWRFFRGDTSRAETPDFNDSGWRVVNLPHDWSIENLPGTNSPFDSNAISKMSGGYTTGRTAWYRKSFILPAEQKNKRFMILFDGIYMNSDFWINGEYLGNHPYGYTSFWFDVTDKIKSERKNVLAVRVKNEGLNSRWYSGSGIYRHIWFKTPGPVHIEPWGINITTPRADNICAEISIKTTIKNMEEDTIRIRLITTIITQDGKELAKNEVNKKMGPVTGTEVAQILKVDSPELWSPDSPSLYKAVTKVYSNRKLSDQTETVFGIRNISVSVKEGLKINGLPVKLKGGCVHHDNGILGASAFDRAEERRIELLKASGFNAIRCAHNPPSPAFLDACDRLGMLVIDECFDMWQKPKNPDDYHLWFDEWWEKDISSMVLRDRNHPSVIMWSLGNEIQERAQPSGVEIMKEFKKVISRLDSTRPYTLAVCEFWDNNNLDWSFTAPAFEQVDVGGYNYQWARYESDHKKFPLRIMMGTESVPMQAFKNWQMVEKHPYVIGDFVWTAMDYLGEAGIGHTYCEGEKYQQLMPYPWFNAWCGDIDIIGNKKPQSYYRDVVWRRSKIELAVHTPLLKGCREEVSYWGWPDERQSWTWPGHDGDSMKVNVYSQPGTVRLELNGRLIGTKVISDSTLLTATFDVPYSPGELRAVTENGGKQDTSVSLITAGNPVSLMLKADRSVIKAVPEELSFVSVSITDDRGNIVADADRTIDFSVSGAGKIVAAGNANPSETQSFQDNKCNAFRGQCLVIIQPNGKAGKIILQAESAGLKPAEVVILTKNRSPR